ncbi:hypothetical protein MAR_035844 [Mya arenaria]|uniref:UPAR/Ly6 domain-containing protein qvr n=1 Tax=Mya arenaria TaxID=6604 RepID=A0ABY7ELA7_MYAAR|nr:protein quiver-like [Mya arenaria]WAR10768.1 hypothetical protein MAR_035844 [Mya arenaria]
MEKFTFLLFFLITATGASRHPICHNCTSSTDPGCTDPFIRDDMVHTIQSCETDWCAKFMRNNGEVVRFCVTRSQIQFMALKKLFVTEECMDGNGVYEGDICFCDSSFCNGGPHAGVFFNLKLTVGLFMVTLLFTFTS